MQGYRYTGNQEYRDTGIYNYRVQECRFTSIRRYRDGRVQKYGDTEIWEHRNIWIHLKEVPGTLIKEFSNNYLI